MKFAIVLILALSLSGCATLGKVADGCRLVLSDKICSAVDVVGSVTKDIQGVKDAVGSDDDAE